MKGKHIGGILILVVGIGIWGYSTFSTYAPKEYLVSATGEKATSTMNTTTGETTPGAKSFILADIATHKDSISCYSSINGSVYDLTLWVNAHPGGPSKILSICGTDGTDTFMNKHHGGQKFMTILSRFKIGTLASQ